MAYTRATVIDAGPAGDTVKEAVLKNDTDLTNIFTHLNTHEAKTSTHGVTGNIVGDSDTQTLTNKTLTSPVINTSVSGTAILDEDDLVSDSATKLATQQSIKAYVDAYKAIVGAELDFFNGTFLESFDALVTSNGTVITMSLEQSGGGDLTAVFSSGRITIDCDPSPQTIALTAGTDSSPQANYIYVLESTGVLTKNTSQWPSAEHVKVGYFLVPSATRVQSDGGCYINQNWNDHRQGTDNQGHLSHLCEAIRLTMDGANWHSGVAGNGDAGTWLVITGSPNEVYFKSTAGVAYQMHTHTVPAWNMQTGDDLHVVNWNGDAYHQITDIASITADANGASLSNKYFNLVFWGTANKTGEYSPLMCNLPTGSYNILSQALTDTESYDVTSIPLEFTKDSTIGFLICRLTLRYSGTTWTLHSTTDLRGVAAGANAGGGLGGGGGGGTSFADNVFTIYDSDDFTRVIDFDLAGITTGNTRTITPADENMTLLSNTQYTDLTDGGETTLHIHDGRYYTESEVDAIISGLGSTYYTESEIDAFLALYYTKIELDGGQLDNRYYTETEIDAIIDGLTTDHGELTGLGDDDHTQYILHSLSLAANDFLVGSGTGTFVKKTLAEAGAILEGDINHDNLQGYVANEHLPGIDEDDFTSNSDAHVPTQQSTKAYVDTYFIPQSLADAANDFLVASGADTFVKKTLAETTAILEADLDHGSIQGLGDDDHSIYILADGTRELSGDWDIGATRKILTNYLKARDAVTNLQLTSADGNTYLNIRNGLADLQGGYMNIDKYLIITGDPSSSAYIEMKADVGGDNADFWKIEATDGAALLKIDSKSTGSYVTALSISPTAIAGALFKDDDTMADDDAGALCSQQSIKAYVDNEIASAPSSAADLTVDDANFDKFLKDFDESTEFLQDLLEQIDEDATEVVESASEPATTYPGMIWIDSDADSAVHGSLIQDADGDTKIQTEESADEDIVRIDTGGTQRVEIGSTFTKIENIISVNAKGYIRSDIGTNVLSLQAANSGLKIINAAANEDHLVVDVDGAVTKPENPAFLHYTATQHDMTTSGAYENVDWTGELYDIGDNWGGNYYWTAPVDGVYEFGISMNVIDFDDAHGRFMVRIRTSNQYYAINCEMTAVLDQDSSWHYVSHSMQVWMDANDTVYIQTYLANAGADQAYLAATTAESLIASYFWGRLVG
jgi:prefoldin subunit 5